MACGQEELLHPFDVAELTVSVWMGRAGEPLPIGLQRVAQLLQQPTNRRAADGVSLPL